MPMRKFTVETDHMLEELIDSNFIESTGDTFEPYRLSINPETNRPYTIWEIWSRLYPKVTRKTFSRELKKCFQEFGIRYFSLSEHGAMYAEMRESIYHRVEYKLGVDLDVLSKKKRKNLSAACSMIWKRYPKEEYWQRVSRYVSMVLSNID